MASCTRSASRSALEQGARFRLDLELVPGNVERANLPHPEIFAALKVGTELLLDDGKLRLRVDAFGADCAETTVLVGGVLSDRKGVNVPGGVLPISALTPKDLADLDFGLTLGVDWVALSFVQRGEVQRVAPLRQAQAKKNRGDPRFFNAWNAYFLAAARPFTISCLASSTVPQPCTFTHLPGSRSL